MENRLAHDEMSSGVNADPERLAGAKRSATRSHVIGALPRATRVEPERRRREEHDFFEDVPVGYLALDHRGGVERANAAALELFARPEEALRGVPLGMCLAADHRERFEQYLAMVSESGLSLEIELDVRIRGEVDQPVLLTTSSVRDGDRTAYRVVVVDVTRQQRMERRLRHARDRLERLAHHDPLTGLPNRLVFFDRLRTAMLRPRDPGHRLAVLFFDIDGFKSINDTLGHAVGDRLLCEVANRVRACAHGDSTIARLGGDEFTVVLEVGSDEASAGRQAALIGDAIRRPIRCGKQEIRVTSSIGVSLFPDHSRSAEELVRCADTAMYRSKVEGRDRVTCYSPALIARQARDDVLESALAAALAERQFELHFQPVFRTESGELSHVEALARWNHPELGLLMPGEFIPLVERSGRIVEFGRWLLEEACAHAAEWMDGGVQLPVAINVSARQLGDADFERRVVDALAEHALPADRLELELTESELMSDRLRCTEVLGRLRALGVAIAIDDFGTGYSSLSRLIDLPITRLKIDRSFVEDLGRSRNAETVVGTIIAMAHRLGLDVVSEGVETSEQLEFLSANGSDNVQGFLLGKPQSRADIHALLAASAVQAAGTARVTDAIVAECRSAG